MGLRRIAAAAACAVLPFNVLAHPATLPDAASLHAVRTASSLLVDLDYGVYNGVYNSATGLNVWKGYVGCESDMTRRQNTAG